MIISLRFLAANLRPNYLYRLANHTRLITTHKPIFDADPKIIDAEKELFSPLILNQANLPVVVKPSLYDSLKEKLGLQGAHRFKQPVMLIAAYRLYLCIQYQVEYDKFFEKLAMPDVMYSFCLITFMHVWLVSVALMQYGRSGVFVRRQLVANMWKDIETRGSKLNATMKREDKKNTYQHLNDIFRAHMFGFDEGLLSDDTILAGAVWRHLMEMREISDFSVLGEMCEYIRKNVHHLEQLTDIDLMRDGIVSFVHLGQQSVDHAKLKHNIKAFIIKKERPES